LTQTQTTLQSGNATTIGALTRENILGDMFHGGTLGYFGEYLGLSNAASMQLKARHNLPFAYGTFGYEPNVQRLFGFPRGITPGGISVNVRLARVIESLDGDPVKHLPLHLQTGMVSSILESAVPEQMFSTSAQPAEGVSAAKALQIASSQGQRIYHITPSNQAQVLPNLHLDSLAMSEITQALATGREVIAHTDRISVSGWTGEGYILFDPVTGDGAYKITGGSNGGVLSKLADLLTLSIGAILEKAADLLKEVYTALFDHVLGAPLFALIDFFVSITSAFKELANACTGALAVAAMVTVGLLSVVGLAVGALFAPILWYAILFAFVYALLMRELVLAEVRVCRGLQ
jgi:hypothetical protein